MTQEMAQSKTQRKQKKETEKKNKNEEEKLSERIHKKVGFWLVLISFIVLIGILLFMWMF